MCSCLFIEMNQTAHISLQIPSISNSVETKSTGSAPLLCGATRVKSLRVFLPRFPQEHRSVVPSGPPLCASAPPVRAAFRDRFGGAQVVFSARGKKSGLQADFFALPPPLPGPQPGATA